MSKFPEKKSDWINLYFTKEPVERYRGCLKLQSSDVADVTIRHGFVADRDLEHRRLMPLVQGSSPSYFRLPTSLARFCD